MPTKQMLEENQRRKELGLAWCSGCKEDKGQAEFEKCPSRRPFGLASMCNECNRKRKNKLAREKYRGLSNEDRLAFNRKSNIAKFGISIEEYTVLLESQEGVCAICKNPETVIHPKTDRPQNLTVDHNHATGEVRGLLCARCNKGIGLLREDPDILLSAISYLNRVEVIAGQEPSQPEPCCKTPALRPKRRRSSPTF